MPTSASAFSPKTGSKPLKQPPQLILLIFYAEESGSKQNFLGIRPEANPTK